MTNSETPESGERPGPRRPAWVGAITLRGRVVLMSATMLAVGAAAGGTALALTYRTALDHERSRLTQAVRAEARMLTERTLSGSAPARQTLPSDVATDPLEVIRSAHASFTGFGSTGERTLGTREGDSIVFFLNQRNQELGGPRSIPFGESRGRPMARALSGETGTMIGKDYRGVTVLAAYQPLPRFGLGLVAKIDVAEVRAPFVSAGLIALGVSAVIALLGIWMSLRVGRPVLRRLDASERQLRDLFQQSRDPIAIMQPGGQFAAVNGAFCQLLGYDVAELSRTLEAELFADPEAHDTFVHQLNEHGHVIEYEAILVTKEGRLIDCELTYTGFKAPDGSLTMYYGLLRDITDRKRAREALRQSEEKHRNLFQNADVGMFRTRIDGSEFLDCNEKLLRILGRSRHEVLGQSTAGHWADPSERERLVRLVRDHGSVEAFECRMRTKQGEVRDCLMSLKLYRDSGILEGSVIDITERKQLERDVLTIAERERERIGRDLHDTLGQLMTGTALMLRDVRSRAERGETVGGDEIGEIETLVRQATTQTRFIAHGLMPLAGGDVRSFGDALTDLASNAEALFGVPCATHFDDSATISSTVAQQLYHIAQEAVTNAVRHGKARAVIVRVDADGGAGIVLSVRDDGTGFPDESERRQGLGLGIMRRRARVIGAALSIERHPEGGTLVRCALPAGPGITADGTT